MALHTPWAMAMHIPSPPVSGFHIGPLFIHFYALMYLAGIAAAIIITRRRWIARGGDPDLVYEIAMWGVPAGIVGGRIYFDVTTPMDIPHEWYGVFAVWQGGLGIWGAVVLAVPICAWRVRRHGASVGQFMDAVAPGLLAAQGIGRIGNYFNKELFGAPTNLPWGLEIPPQYRYAIAAPFLQDRRFSTFQPTFLYELIWDFLLAALIVWAGHHLTIRLKGQFALYVAGYSGFRIVEESMRIDSSQYFFGLRLNFYIASGLTLFGLLWFAWIQRYGQYASAGLPSLQEAAVQEAAAASAGPAGAADTAAGAGADPAAGAPGRSGGAATGARGDAAP
jgi:prolipoprotein diacylglyceryl transferase